MSNFVVVVAFLSFIIAPACLADAALYAKFERAREIWRALLALAREPWLDRAIDAVTHMRTLPFRQLRSAMLRFLLFTLELPPVLWAMAREHYRQPSPRLLKKPTMLTVRGATPPW